MPGHFESRSILFGRPAFLYPFQFPIIIQLDRLLEQQNVVTTHILPQWQSLRAMIYSSPDCEKKLERLTWRSINGSYSDTKKSLLSVFDLILTVPAPTAECERGFFEMKRVKSEWRCRLATCHSNSLQSTDGTVGLWTNRNFWSNKCF